MNILLSRDEFRESVFKRDNFQCVVCKEQGQDAHHLFDRKLFEDGGYYIDNGVTLCEQCHIQAEKSELSIEVLRESAGIKNIILPSGLLNGVIYDKWGNAKDFNFKYPRSLHAQISLGTTSDDRIMPNGYIEVFSKMKNLVITEKLDGQNLSFNKEGVFARSHAAITEHAWDRTMVHYWESIKHDLGDIELFGESMYAVHSIQYQKLESHFYLFAIRQNGLWLSWEEVKWWAELFDLPVVPEIPPTQFSLQKVFETLKKENQALQTWLGFNLGMDWEDYVEAEGQLGGFDPMTGKPCCEGFVIRNADAFKTNEGLLPVAANEFDSLFKLVRRKHVTTDTHWTKNWKRAKLKWEL